MSSTFVVAGIDIGSQTVKSVIMDSNRNILASEVIQRGIIVDEEGARDSMRIALEKAGVKKSDIVYTVSTGYGRTIAGIGDKNITEISCHAKGAHFMNPQVRTIIDIGGQDSKVIRLDENGMVDKFIMNDKCAAGTGRFIQVISTALGVPLEEAGRLSLQAKNPARVSSTCVVFAESEVISLKAKGVDKADILAGVHQGIANRMKGLVAQLGVKPVVMMTGGVAKNQGVVYYLEKVLGEKIYLAEDPQIIGAIGAALFALNYALEKANDSCVLGEA